MKKALLAILLVGSLISCKKEGCTDPVAVNYSDEAKKDDNSCDYETKVKFWFDQSTSDFLYNEGSDLLYYYVNDELIGSNATTVYYDSSPSCDQGGVMTFVTNSKDVNQTHNVRIQDEFDDIIWQFNVSCGRGECIMYQLVH